MIVLTEAAMEREMTALEDFLDQRARFNGNNYGPGAAALLMMAEAIKEMNRHLADERKH